MPKSEYTPKVKYWDSGKNPASVIQYRELTSILGAIVPSAVIDTVSAKI